MCSTQTRLVKPGWVRSKEGAWHLVIQSPDWGINQVCICTSPRPPLTFPARW